MSNNLWVQAILEDEDGKVIGSVARESLGLAFRAGWNLLIEQMSVVNPPGITMKLVTELRARHKFTSQHPIMREFGTMEMKATHLSRYIEYGKVSCELCRWDEAKVVKTRFAVTDPFGFRSLTDDLESLCAASQEEEVWVAPHKQVRVNCGMCEALREKGIDPVTLSPTYTHSEAL